MQLAPEVISDIVGVPGDLRPELRDLTNTLGFRAATEDESAAAAQRVIEIAAATIASRRAAPAGDWLDTLIAASPDDDSPDAAPVRAVVALITGGHHSTSRGIGSLIARLLADPALRALVQEDSGRLPAAADEVLRLHTPLPSFSRRATEDSSVGGTEIGAGQQVLLDYAAANRDPGAYPDPERLKLDRRPQHLAFGWGRHRCVGMHLARAEMRIAAAELLAFAPDIELAEPVRWRGPAEPERLLARSAVAERAVRETVAGACPRTTPDSGERC